MVVLAVAQLPTFVGSNLPELSVDVSVIVLKADAEGSRLQPASPWRTSASADGDRRRHGFPQNTLFAAGCGNGPFAKLPRLGAEGDYSKGGEGRTPTCN
jgi:hypothetical protein